MNLKQTLSKTLDIILPPRCGITGDIVDVSGMLSPVPWKDIRFIAEPYCDTCGIPFDFVTEGEMICGSCIDNPPHFNKARSVMVYDDTSRRMILAFKHGDRLQLINGFNQWLLRAGRDILLDSDIILPVPLHRKRLWQRRYNQSAILAKSLAKSLPNIKYRPQLLSRTRSTPPQKGLTRKERQKNIAGAIRMHIQDKNLLSGKNICVIDDVYTSGATLNECAKILKKAGANNVYALTLARVLL